MNKTIRITNTTLNAAPGAAPIGAAFASVTPAVSGTSIEVIVGTTNSPFSVATVLDNNQYIDVVVTPTTTISVK